MSKQPDEFIQFKALAEMSQRQGISKLDPRLYQYGGLWIYPVGALVRGAMAIGYIESPPAGVPAKEFYLDHPEVFGKFYVVARAYSTLWGVVAALAISSITRRLTNSNTLAFLAAAAFILLPVTRTAAHEAKPHLAGAALCLCSVIAAAQFVETGRRRRALLAGALCGAALAMVVSMLLSLAVLPMMAWLRWRKTRADDLNSPPLAGGAGGGGGSGRAISDYAARGMSTCPGAPGTGAASGEEGKAGGAYSSPLAGEVGRVGVSGEEMRTEQSSVSRPPPAPSRKGRGVVIALWLASVAALLVYALTNPFLLYNALFHREILLSNLGNSTAMYGVGDLGVALTSALRITIQGMTLGGVMLAGLSLVVLVIAYFVRTGGPFFDHRAARAPQHAEQTSVATSSEVVDRRSCADGWLLAAPAVCVLIQFVLLAAGKPAEYARFGIVMFATAACLFVLALRFAKVPPRVIEWTIVSFVIMYIASFLLPVINRGHPTQWRLAVQSVDARRSFGKNSWTLGLSHEPAPWSVMPLNLFRDQLVLTKPAADPKSAIYDVYLYPSNLSSQVGFDGTAESVDWAKNRTQMILGSLPTTRPVAPSPTTNPIQ